MKDNKINENLNQIFDSKESNEQKQIWLKNLLYNNNKTNEYINLDWRILATLKDLLGIEDWLDPSRDIILEVYIKKAEKSIQSYLNYKTKEFEEVREDFVIQIADLATFYYKNRGQLGVIQMSQGSRSQTLERGIPKYILASLPLPRVRVVGGR